MAIFRPIIWVPDVESITIKLLEDGWEFNGLDPHGEERIKNYIKTFTETGIDFQEHLITLSNSFPFPCVLADSPSLGGGTVYLAKLITDGKLSALPALTYHPAIWGTQAEQYRQFKLNQLLYL